MSLISKKTIWWRCQPILFFSASKWHSCSYGISNQNQQDLLWRTIRCNDMDIWNYRVWYLTFFNWILLSIFSGKFWSIIVSHLFFDCFLQFHCSLFACLPPNVSLDDTPRPAQICFSPSLEVNYSKRSPLHQAPTCVIQHLTHLLEPIFNNCIQVSATNNHKHSISH